MAYSLQNLPLNQFKSAHSFCSELVTSPGICCVSDLQKDSLEHWPSIINNEAINASDRSLDGISGPWSQFARQKILFAHEQYRNSKSKQLFDSAGNDRVLWSRSRLFTLVCMAHKNYDIQTFENDINKKIFNHFPPNEIEINREYADLFDKTQIIQIKNESWGELVFLDLVNSTNFLSIFLKNRPKNDTFLRI